MQAVTHINIYTHTRSACCTRTWNISEAIDRFLPVHSRCQPNHKDTCTHTHTCYHL